MKKILGILSIAIIAMCFVGCAKNTPEATADRFMSAMKKGNFEKALKETTLNENQQKAMAAMLDEKMTDEVKKELKEMSYKVGEAKISDDGETATVEITSKDKDGKEDSQEMKLKKIDGKWKISMDQNALGGK